MTDNEILLAELRQANSTLDKLITKLYGENGFEGDIPEIKERLEKVNGKVRGNEIRSKVNQTVLFLGVPSIISVLVTKIKGLW